MSEKKTAEIKFRIAPSAKARWQTAAAVEDISLSQLISNAVDGYVASRNLEPTWPVPVESLLDEDDAAVMRLSDVQRSPWAFPTTKVVDPGEDDGAYLTEFEIVTHPGVPRGPAVPTNLTEACGCRPWEFCRHKDEA